MLSLNALAARRSIIKSRAVARGMVRYGKRAAAQYLPGNSSPATSRDPFSSSPFALPHNSTSAPDSRSPFAEPLLSRSEKRRLAQELTAYHLRIDFLAWEIGRKGSAEFGCAWIITLTAESARVFPADFAEVLCAFFAVRVEDSHEIPALAIQAESICAHTVAA